MKGVSLLVPKLIEGNGYVARQTPWLCAFVHMTDRPNNLFRIYLFICLFVYLFIYLFDVSRL